MSRCVAIALIASALFAPVAFAEDAPPDGGAAVIAPPAPAPPVAKLDPKKLKAPKQTPELLESGRLAFAMSCVVCHGEKGVGDGPAGMMLNPKPRDFSKDPFKQGSKPAEVFVTITEGVKDTPMVGWPQLSEDERWGLSYYVLSLSPKGKKAAKP